MFKAFSLRLTVHRYHWVLVVLHWLLPAGTGARSRVHCLVTGRSASAATGA
jgi:hypothetical protein